MGLFTNQDVQDLLLVKPANETLSFCLTLWGEKILNVKKYEVCFSEKSLPYFLILDKEDKLYYYFFEDNKWKKIFLCFLQDTRDFYLTVDSANHIHLLIENDAQDSYKYYCRLDKRWSEKIITKQQGFKLLKWFVKEDKISILGTTADNFLTYWLAPTSNPENWSKIYEYPLSGKELLNIWFKSYSGLEFLTAEFNSCRPTLIYNNFETSEKKLDRKNVAQLKQGIGSKPILLRDTYNTGIVYTSDNQLFLYKYSKKDKEWVEFKTDSSLFPLAVEEIVTTNGIANSRLALTKILNLELEIPIVVKLDDLVRALEIKKAQSLGFYGIRRLGR